MHKKSKLLALFMTIVLLFSSVSFAVSSESVPLSETPVRVTEVENLRETNSETYLLSDGTYECVVYAYDKYYKAADNTLQLASNKIVPAGTARSEKLSSDKLQYKNAANAFDVHFAGSGTPEISIAFQGAAVTFSPVTAGKNTAAFSIGKVSGCKTLSELTATGDNTVTYSNAFPGADLVYVLDNNVLKEYIILNSSAAGNTFNFRFSLDGVKLESKGKYADFVDGNRSVLFSLDPLFAVDANGVVTENLTYTFTPEKDTNQVTVNVTLDKEYFSSPDRVFPIIIDPTVMISSTETADACVCSYTPNTNYRLNTRLRTGMDDEYGIRRSFIKFNIPNTIPENSVTAARLEIEKTAGATPTIKAYQCVSSWSSATITWNNMPDDEENFALESTLCTRYSATSSWYVMNVTEIVQDWIDGLSLNYGFILMDNEEGLIDHWTTWYSSDAASPHKPELYITYIESEVEYPDSEDYEPEEPEPDPDDPDPHPTPDPEPEPDSIPLIRFYGVTVTDHPHSLDLHNVVLQYAEDLFDNSEYPNALLQTGCFDPGTFKDELLNTAIVTTFSHGHHWNYGLYHATGLVLNENSLNTDDLWVFMSTDYRGTTNDPNDTYDRFAYISDTDNFSNLKLAVFVGCETALSDESEANLAYRIFDRGANVSVGFDTNIDCQDAIIWIKYFYDYLFDGYTVENAAQAAVGEVVGEAVEQATEASDEYVVPSITNENCKVYGVTTATLDDLL